MIRPGLFRLDHTFERDPAVASWFQRHQGELGTLALYWFTVMRHCRDEVREILHDGCPVACLGNAAFAYVDIFTTHVNVGFYQGSSLYDPAHLLRGTGKFMRHVLLRANTPIETAALAHLIHAAYHDITARLEHG